jgi:hypothetical protein
MDDAYTDTVYPTYDFKISSLPSESRMLFKSCTDNVVPPSSRTVGGRLEGLDRFGVVYMALPTSDARGVTLSMLELQPCNYDTPESERCFLTSRISIDHDLGMCTGLCLSVDCVSAQSTNDIRLVVFATGDTTSNILQIRSGADLSLLYDFSKSLGAYVFVGTSAGLLTCMSHDATEIELGFAFEETGQSTSSSYISILHAKIPSDRKEIETEINILSNPRKTYGSRLSGVSFVSGFNGGLIACSDYQGSAWIKIKENLSDYPGPMYPPEYKVLTQNIIYQELEDEFDIVKGDTRNHLQECDRDELSEYEKKLTAQLEAKRRWKLNGGMNCEDSFRFISKQLPSSHMDVGSQVGADVPVNDNMLEITSSASLGDDGVDSMPKKFNLILWAPLPGGLSSGETQRTLQQEIQVIITVSTDYY